MIRCRKLRDLCGLCSIIVCSIQLSACGDYSPRRLAYGTAIPDARLEVALPAPVTKYDIYLRFQETAWSAGFEKPIGRVRVQDQPEEDTSPSSFHWNSKPDSDQYPNRVSFMIPQEPRSPSKFTFVFRKSDTSSFAAKEWRMFDKWRTQILPQAFPDAVIKITRHPAGFTDFSDLMQISKETGMDIPESVRVEYEEWRQAN